MTAPRLSICIPVYNFAAFLGETLESLASQDLSATEIVVLDGGSTDHTPELVARFQERLPSLRYERRPVRGGIDRDIEAAIAAARGEFCWLLSGDDLARPGAVARILDALDPGLDVVLLESMLCDLGLRPIVAHRLVDVSEPTTFDLRDEAQRHAYFRRALNTAAFFSFCSSIVVNRASWNAADVGGLFYGSCFSHAARIFAMLPTRLVVRYLTRPMLDKRCENDSFLTRGLTHRLGLTIDGYHRIADAFFGHESLEAFHIRRSVRCELPPTMWIEAKIEIANRYRPGESAEFLRLVNKQYCDSTPANVAIRLACKAVPGPALVRLRRVSRAVRARLRR